MAYDTPSERVATEGRLVQRIRELEAAVQRLSIERGVYDVALQVIEQRTRLVALSGLGGMVAEIHGIAERALAALTPQDDR